MVGANQRYVAAGDALANAAAHLTLRSGRQVAAKLVIGPPPHCGPSHDIFGRGFGHEMLGRNDRDLACLHIRLVDHPAHAAKMVAMAVTVDDCGDRRAPSLSLTSLSAAAAVSRVVSGSINIQPVCAFDDRHVRHIEPAHLPHIVRQRDIVRACAAMPMCRHRLGFTAVRRLPFHPCISIEIPDRFAVLGFNDRVSERANDNRDRQNSASLPVFSRKFSRLPTVGRLIVGLKWRV